MSKEKKVSEPLITKILENYETWRQRGVPELEAALLTLTASLHDAITFLAVAVAD